MMSKEYDVWLEMFVGVKGGVGVWVKGIGILQCCNADWSGLQGR